ncbi:MAG TPA: cell division protein ZapB [Thermoanaerobaculia bacterium]|nr:cell division protein ZapB [Thermoanaerobaculia bacterium]
MQIDWLEGLETRVHDAVEQLGELREENRTLRETVQNLETRLAGSAGQVPAPWEDEGGEEVEVLQGRVQDLERQLADADAVAKTWEAEREEVRRRVEALTARLEGLAAG